MFFDCYHLGHETADIMVEKITLSLQKSGLGLDKMITLSRDNPTVMKALERKLGEKAKLAGNPGMLSFPDYLHPGHSGLREGMKDLGSDIEKFLVDAHAFFKLSTSRRWEILKIREMIMENDQFFLRFVRSRWLTTGPVAERLVEHWASLREYILTFLPSQNDQSSKETMNTVRYQDMVQFLKPGQDVKNLARLQFLIFLCKLNKPFLTVFQSEKPKIHLLYLECLNLIKVYMKLICHPDKVAYNGPKISKLTFKEFGLLLPLSKCFFGAGAEKEILKLPEDDRLLIRTDFRNAVVKTLKYLVSHFPLTDRFLCDLAFLDPDFKDDSKFVTNLLRAAGHTGRFAEHELQDLGVQLQAVTSLGLKEYDEKHDQLDLFWSEIWKKVEGVIKDEPVALIKFIKIVCSLPHSNAFLERGFSDLKRVITGRELLSIESTNSQKTILDNIRLAGGSLKVLVTLDMIESVKSAGLRKEQEMRKKEREDERQRTQKRNEEEMREKKRKHEDEKASWQAKHDVKAEVIEVLQQKLTIQTKSLTDALKVAAETRKESVRKAGVGAAQEAQRNYQLTSELLQHAQKEMDKILGKKPKFK